MAKRRHRDDQTPDLFDHAVLFPVETPRELTSALDFNTTIAGAMSRACDEAASHGISREEIARRMSATLGRHVKLSMINAYTAQSRDTHTISLVRWKAFIRATGCLWLWNVAIDGDGLTIMQGEEALHAQASLAEKRAKALLEEARQLRARAPLDIGRGARR